MTAPIPPAAAPPRAAPPRVKQPRDELTIISHSNLFYWWPVWLCGFIMAAVTYFEGYVMVVLPAKNVGAAVEADATIKTPARNEKGEEIKEDDKVKTNEKPLKSVVIVYAPQDDDKTHVGVPVGENKEAVIPYLRVSPHKALGVTFVIMWSVLVIVVAVALTVIFIVTGFWETLLTWFSWLDVRINMAGYITISTFLLIIWALAVFIFDKQRYITFTAGQFRVCDEIGGGQQVYPTDGMTLQKQRSDLFRHYILGLGSGDLVVRTGAQSHHYDLPNVLFINSKVRQIEELISRKVVIDTH